MKANQTPIFLASIFLMGSMFISCSKDEIVPASAENAGMRLKSESANLEYTGCETQCIAEEGTYYSKTGQAIIGWGGKTNNSNTKTVDIEYYNTETEFILKVKSTNGFSDLIINGLSVWTNGPVAADTWATYTTLLGENWAACDNIAYTLQVAGNGPQAEFEVDYNLIGLCGCEESFAYTQVTEGVYTFTYIPAESMDDAVLVFTIPQSYYVSGLEGWTRNGQTLQNTMDLEACESYTWTIQFTPDCDNTNGNSNRNVWTDFKVNNESKKNDNTPNIVMQCN